MDALKQQKMKKYIAMGLFAIVGICIIYFIFGGAKKNNIKSEKTGINSELPAAMDSSIVDDKESAYETQNPIAENQKADMISSLGELSQVTSSQIKDIAHGPSSSNVNSLVSSTRDITHSSYKDELIKSNNISSQRKLKEQMESYERKMRNMNSAKQSITSYLDMQKSLQMPKNEENVIKQKPETIKVREYEEASIAEASTVSTLKSKRKNIGFNSAVGAEYNVGRNTVPACIHKNQVVVDGQRVILRLQEPLQVGRYRLARNSPITGICKIAGDRLNISITTVECDGNILPVDMAVYDLDGIAGIAVPGSMELDAVKETAASIGQNMGSGMTITSSVGDQIIGGAIKGVIQGASSLVSRKTRVVKVTLKENYKVLLLPKKKS